MPGLLIITWLVVGTAIAEEPPPHDPPDFQATQVTLAIDRYGRHEPFRATVLAIGDEDLTVLTAARHASRIDNDHPVRLFPNDGVLGALSGTVLSVTQNPAYRPKGSSDVAATKATFSIYAQRSFNYRNPNQQRYGTRTPITNRPTTTALDRELPGADHAVIRLRFPKEPGQGGLRTLSIRPAPPMAGATYPGPSGGKVIARVIDAKGQEHTVRAGNFQNPRMLEWGHGFDPKISDVGGGVFIVREGDDGQTRPFLIGVNMGPDDRGGSAALVSKDMPWLAEALREGPSAKKDEGR